MKIHRRQMSSGKRFRFVGAENFVKQDEIQYLKFSLLEMNDLSKRVNVIIIIEFIRDSRMKRSLG